MRVQLHNAIVVAYTIYQRQRTTAFSLVDSTIRSWDKQAIIAGDIHILVLPYYELNCRFTSNEVISTEKGQYGLPAFCQVYLLQERKTRSRQLSIPCVFVPPEYLIILDDVKLTKHKGLAFLDPAIKFSGQRFTARNTT